MSTPIARGGARDIDQMVTHLRRMNAPEEVIEAYDRMRAKAIHVVLADDPTSDTACLSFIAMPGEGLLIGYHSMRRETAVGPLLERCAQTLGYGIELV